MKNILKAFFFLWLLCGSGLGLAQNFSKKVGIAVLDTTLNPERYEARYSYIPPRGIIRVQNRQNSQILYVKVIDTLTQITKDNKVLIALSKRAYNQLNAREVYVEYNQEKKLRYDLGQLPEGIAKIETRYQLARRLLALQQTSQADSLVKVAFKLSQKYKYTQGVVVGHYFFARLGTNGDPFRHLAQYLAAREKSTIIKQKIGAFNFAGEFYQRKDQYHKAIEWMLRATKLLKESRRSNADINASEQRINNCYLLWVLYQLRNKQFTTATTTFRRWIHFLENERLTSKFYQKEEKIRSVFMAYQMLTKQIHTLAPERVSVWYREWWQWTKKHNAEDAYKNAYANLFFYRVTHRYLQRQQFEQATRCVIWAKQLNRELCKSYLWNVLKRVRQEDITTDQLLKFFSDIKPQVSVQWYSEFIKDTRVYLWEKGRRALAKNELLAEVYFQKLTEWQKKHSNNTQISWGLEGIVTAYARKRYFAKALEYNQQLINHWIKIRQKPAKIRKLRYHQSFLYYQTLQYTQSLKISREVFEKGGAFPREHLQRTIDFMLQKPPLHKQRQQIKGQLKQWKRKLESRGKQKAATFVVTQLKRLEE